MTQSAISHVHSGTRGTGDDLFARVQATTVDEINRNAP